MTPFTRLPITVRIAAATAGSLVAVLAVVGVVVYLQLGAALRAAVDQRLAATAAALPADLDEGDLDDLDDGPLDGLDTDVLVQVVDAAGTVVAGDGLDDDAPLLPPADLARARGDEPVLRTVRPDGDDDAVRALAVPYADGSSVAIVAADLDDVEDAQAALLAVYGPVAVLGAALAGALGYLVARSALAPVRRMTREATAIGASDLSRRLSVPRRDDEIAALSRTLNGMLGRLDAAVSRERTFTADASHELRTPLAILRAEVELARDRTADAATREALDSAVEECVRLAGLVDDLLVLARADAQRVDGRRPVDLDALVSAVLSRFRTLAARRGVRLATEGSAVVRGDERSLERALANLVDNALRHTPDGGSVTVRVAPSGTGARIEVTDTGSGVPGGQLGSLFDRFTRVDSARNSPGGAGLGLAIVAAVARAHGGGVRAENRPAGGLRVVVDLAA